MSEHQILETEEPEPTPEEPPEDGDEAKLKREVEISPPSSFGDGRTLDLRIVPYNTIAVVSDEPHNIPYRETWLPGSFTRQLKAPDRVKVFLNVEHEQGFRGVVGHGIEFRDAPDALYGSFRMLAGSDGDKALELVNAGVLDGVSLEFNPRRSIPRADGVIARIDARLDKVSLARRESGYAKVAYKEAEVLAVRTTQAAVEEPRNTVLDEKLAAVGYQPLVRGKVIDGAWDGSVDRFTDDEYERSCLLRRTDDGSAKERFAVPVLEPNGDLNVNALAAAATILSRGSLPRELRADAARKLIRYYRMAQQSPPASLVALAQA